MIFHETSKECYDWLQKQPNVKEESITDWLLYTVSKKTDKFYYKAFSRNEEATNGADWEWWVVTNGLDELCAYRFLVQAKKLKKNQDNYPLISYGNRNGLQIDLLIDSAAHRNAMPIYMYYSVSRPDKMVQIDDLNHCYVIACCKNCINGAYMSMAQTVKDKVFNSPRKQLSDVDLLNNSVGLSVCDLLKHMPLAETQMELLNRHYIKTMSDNNEKATNGIRHSGNAIPSYLNVLINREKEQLDWYESEFKYHLNDIAGIAIIDLRK